MITTIRRVGNSRGVIIPKPLLEEAGLEKEAEIDVEYGRLVLRRPEANPRSGWAEASRKVAEEGDDKLACPEFGNQGDKDFRW